MKRFFTILVYAIINFLGTQCCAQDYVMHNVQLTILDIYQRFISRLKNTPGSQAKLPVGLQVLATVMSNTNITIKLKDGDPEVRVVL